MKSVTALCLSLLAFTLPHAAAAQASLEQALQQCRTEQNALKRLVCYDEINAGSTVTAVPAPATPAPVASVTPAPVTTPAPATSAADDFGIEHRKRAAEETPDTLYGTVKSVQYSPRKELIVEFDNGQRWRQTGTDYYKIAVGEQHYLKRGALNSFFLGNDSNNRTIRVRREQ
ncbi:hypothetical protein QE250_00920 [Chromatiaceae bacterium AAb-1]|nr:hypothetical protein [Chromatiaceae bacterium AAb-1]